tara:strand:+ start:249 stop:1082 length:834 start_codon:yes stop_codon:yes gene_type:complete
MIRVKNQSILVSIIIIAFIFPKFANAQHFKGSIGQTHPKILSYHDHLGLGKKIEKYLLPIQLGTFLYLEYGIEHHSSKKPASGPNSLDGYFRNKLRWNRTQMDNAESASDMLLYGVFLGSLPIIPLLSDNAYVKILRVSLDVLSLNGIITDVVKMTVGRQRPDSFHGTRETTDDSFRSFFSGHTSTTFALATSNALILSDIYPEKKTMIWVGNLSLAAATGYLRIAADKHYMSDVICGGIVGYSIARIVHRKWERNGLKVKFDPMKHDLSINLSLNL